MQNKRLLKKKLAKQQQQQMALADGKKVNFLVTLSTMDPKQKEEMASGGGTNESSSMNSDKFNMENFLNPMTRENTFQMLFNEVMYLIELILFLFVLNIQIQTN